MPRRRKIRKVDAPPKMKGFKPFGILGNDNEHILMQYEEYETIKLVIHDDLSQDDASTRMEISRPTLTRIYNSALKKIGRAFVEGKSIIFEGGEYEFNTVDLKCDTCFGDMSHTESGTMCKDCKS
ncbi:DUF134 domain-containing protein [Formosa sp. 3Alg 14/1]|uniref:DUF134 domain-containing protein n=1 Tax=Formosa sp. 3Alg 14/1 TaxID=3382190 RepID=UPI0039BDC32D